MEKKINLEQILKSKLTFDAMAKNNSSYTFNKVIEAMRKACVKAIELAAKNARVFQVTETDFSIINKPKQKKYTSYGGELFKERDGDNEIWYEVDKQSITDTIKQIE
jgi:hypothetical protein